MKAIIIEDETTAVNSLKAVLAQNTVTQIEVIAELESIEESVDFFRTSPHPDIIFMDIHLADGSAFKIFEQVEIDAPVIGFAIGTVGVIGGVFVTLACVCYLTYCAFGVKTAKA